MYSKFAKCSVNTLLSGNNSRLAKTLIAMVVTSFLAVSAMKDNRKTPLGENSEEPTAPTENSNGQPGENPNHISESDEKEREQTIVIQGNIPQERPFDESIRPKVEFEPDSLEVQKPKPLNCNCERCGHNLSAVVIKKEILKNKIRRDQQKQKQRRKKQKKLKDREEEMARKQRQIEENAINPAGEGFQAPKWWKNMTKMLSNSKKAIKEQYKETKKALNEKLNVPFEHTRDDFKKLVEEVGTTYEDLKDEVYERGTWSPRVESGYRETRIGNGHHEQQWYLWHRDQTKSELIQCPNCKMVLEVVRDGEGKYGVRKKAWDRNWKLGVTGASLCMGTGFACYMYGLRTGESVADQKFGHVMFVLGAFLLLFFLLRGHGYRDGNSLMLLVKMIGMSTGMISTISFVVALTGMNSVTDGANLDMSELYTNSATAFNWAIAFGLFALLIILVVNIHHNHKNGAWVKGLANIGLLVAAGVGTCTFGDISVRIMNPAENMKVGVTSFMWLWGCVTYLLLYMIVRVMWAKNEGKYGWKVGSVVFTVIASASAMCFISTVQDGMFGEFSAAPIAAMFVFLVCIFYFLPNMRNGIQGKDRAWRVCGI